MKTTRLQRRCKHKWYEVEVARFSGTITSRCSKCLLYKREGGLVDKINLDLNLRKVPEMGEGNEKSA